MVVVSCLAAYFVVFSSQTCCSLDFGTGRLVMVCIPLDAFSLTV